MEDPHIIQPELEDPRREEDAHFIQPEVEDPRMEEDPRREEDLRTIQEEQDHRRHRMTSIHGLMTWTRP